jgi:hypothetical protein
MLVADALWTLPAAAATIATPARSPYVVPAGPAAFVVVATGFTPNANVFVEQCDGMSPITPRWSPTINCDLGSAPPPASADAHGTATFAGSRIFQPFVGESPQGLFNCLGARQRPPNNQLKSYTNCQLRVSTNNSSLTSDQVFLTLALPGTSTSTTVSHSPASTTTGRTTAPPTTVTRGAATRAQAAGRATSTSRGEVGGSEGGGQAGSPLAAARQRRRSGNGSHDTGAAEPAAIAGYLLVLIGASLAVAAWYGGRRRRAQT